MQTSGTAETKNSERLKEKSKCSIQRVRHSKSMNLFKFSFFKRFYSGCWSASLLCTSKTGRLELSAFLRRVLLACRVLNYHAFCSGCHWSRSKVPFCLYRFNWRLDVANSNGEVTQFQMNSICPSSGSSLLACFAQLTWRVYPRSWLEAPESAAWSVTLSKCQN